MKIIFIILTLLLTSCSHESHKEIEYNYTQVEHLKIDYKNMFNLAKVDYFVYIYSISCFHCEQLKDIIIPYSLSEKYPTYFIEYSSEILICDSINSTYFKDSVDDICILGTPTLIEIKDKILIENIAGKSSIELFLENR